jgi:hypothetical protein
MMPHLAQWLDEEAELQGEAAKGPDLREGVTGVHAKAQAPAFAAR